MSFWDLERPTAGEVTADKDALIHIEHLTMRFGKMQVVDDVSFTARQGEITAIIGPNGAGKTTIINCVTGFYKPTSGLVCLSHPSRGQFLLERMESFRIARRAGVARTFQTARLFHGMTVFENLMVAQYPKLMSASLFSIAGLVGARRYTVAAREAMERAKYWLNEVDLYNRADINAGNLPYGDQRRLEIVRAMCSEPVALCLDEPAAGLNPRESLALNDLLLSIRAEHGVGLLLIEHDMRVVMEISDHVVVLDHGCKISDGSRDFVRNDPVVIKAYLGVEEGENVPAGLSEQGAA